MARHGRAWQDIKAKELQVGDVIQNKGLIESIEDRSEWEKIEVFFLSRESHSYGLEEVVTAFSKTKKPSLTEDPE